MNACTKRTSLAVLLALGLAKVPAWAAEPPRPELPPDLDKLVGQPVDLAPWAYAWRADREVQERPEACFALRRLELLEKRFRLGKVEVAPGKWVDLADRKGGAFTAAQAGGEGPMIPSPKGELHAVALWEAPVGFTRIELRWPKDGRIPPPEAVEARYYPARNGWFGIVWDRLLGKPQVSADRLTWTYSAEGASPDPKKAPKVLSADMVAVFVQQTDAAAARKFAVPSIHLISPITWKRLDVEVEWGFQPGTEKLEFDGQIEGYFGKVGQVAPLAGDTGTATTVPVAWHSRAKGAGRRGIVASLLCLSTDAPFWSEPPTPGQSGKKSPAATHLHSLFTVRTKSGSFTFLPRDVEKEPILAPEYGFFVAKARAGVGGRDFAADLKAKGLKTILEMTREHREATAEEALRQIKLALLPAGTTLPPFAPVEAPPMEVQVPEKWWNEAWANGVYQVKKVHSYWQCSTEAAHQVHPKHRVGLHEQAARELNDWLKLPGVRVEGEFVDADGNFHHGNGHDWCSSGGATGMHLMNMVEHYLFTGDKDWFVQHKDRMQKAADWLIRQRNEYLKEAPNRKDLWCAGLQPPAASSECWGLNQCRWFYYIDAVSCEALLGFARVLAEVDAERGKTYLAEAERYREDIRRAVDRSLAITPVRKLRNGTYRSYSGGACYSRGQFGWGWSGWNYGCEDLLHLQILIQSLGWSADDTRLAGACEAQEDAFLFTRNSAFLAAKRREKGLAEAEDWFYSGIPNAMGWFFLTDAHLLRDDVPAFLRSWINVYAGFVCPNTEGKGANMYFFSEGFPGDKLGGGSVLAFPNGNSTAHFMRNFRNLLVMEIDQSLWLARATPRAWLEQGKRISVKNAPTHFGSVAYEIVSDADHGKINATVEMPSRNAPTRVVLRLRHPKAAPIKAVTVNGHPSLDFDKDKETIVLKGLTGTVAVTARY
jgi:hypothetical protein